MSRPNSAILSIALQQLPLLQRRRVLELIAENPELLNPLEEALRPIIERRRQGKLSKVFEQLWLRRKVKGFIAELASKNEQ